MDKGSCASFLVARAHHSPSCTGPSCTGTCCTGTCCTGPCCPGPCCHRRGKAEGWQGSSSLGLLGPGGQVHSSVHWQVATVRRWIDGPVPGRRVPFFRTALRQFL